MKTCSLVTLPTIATKSYNKTAWKIVALKNDITIIYLLCGNRIRNLKKRTFFIQVKLIL